MKSKHYLILILFPLYLFYCRGESEIKSNAGSSEKNIVYRIDSVKVYHSTLPVKIPFSGYLDYWKNQTISTADSVQIIAVLVDERQPVKINDFVFGLWSLKETNEYTPKDIRAPFNGIIDRIYVKVGDRAGVNTPLAHIYDDAFLQMRTTIRKYRAKYIKKGLIANIYLPEDTLKGFIRDFDPDRSFLTMLYENPEKLSPGFQQINGEVLCGKIQGDFIAAKFFTDTQILQVYIDEESSFPLRQVGLSDTLALISPALPKLNQISIILDRI